MVVTVSSYDDPAWGQATDGADGSRAEEKVNGEQFSVLSSQYQLAAP